MESSAGKKNVTDVTDRPLRLHHRNDRVASTVSWFADHRKRRIMLLSLVVVLGALLLGVTLILLVALSGRDVSQTLRLPSWVESRIQRDEIAYPVHVMLARSFGAFRLSPLAEGLQWLKAAAHAHTDEQIRTIGTGLRSALVRTEPSELERVSGLLCLAAFRGSRTGHSMAIALSGLDCSIELRIVGHVSEDQPIYYRHNPPMGGPHYATPYPQYGVVTSPVAPGYWVHNLEHGAVVVLYRCEGACPDLVAALQEFYADLPPNQNSANGQPRLLATEYPDLPGPLAVVTWGQTMMLDRFDAEVIREFYLRHVDRGPECRNLRCPS